MVGIKLHFVSGTINKGILGTFHGHPVTKQDLIKYVKQFPLSWVRAQEYNMLDEVNMMLENILNDEKMLPNIAKIMKKYYDALIAEGFSEDIATKIASNYKAT